MKKILSILAAVGLSATTGTVVIACGTDKPEEKGDFTVQLTNETKMVVGQEGKLEISNYNELKATLKGFVIIIPTMGPGSGVISQVSFDEEKGIFTINGLKLGSVKVQVQAVEIISNFLVAPAKKLSNKLTIEVKASNIQLSEIVTARELKSKEGKDLPNNEDITIIEAVERLNVKAVGKVKIEEGSIITDTSAKIIALREGEFIGSVTVNFKVTPLPKLDGLFEKTDLGELNDKKPLTIVQAVEYWNKKTKNKVAVKEGSITDTSAKIIPKFDGQYQGEVDVTFRIKGS